MKRITLFLLLASIKIVYSQYVPEWVQVQSQTNLNIDNSDLSAIDGTGNFFFFFSYDNAGNYNLILTKFNNNGIFLWQREYNSSAPDNQDRPKKLIIDQSGNIIVLGNANSQSYTDNKIFLVVYNSSGLQLNSIEYKRQGNPITAASDILKDNTGNYFICGTVANDQTFIDSALIAKFDHNLTVQWVRTLRDTNSSFNYIQNIKIDPSNNIYASGQSGISIINVKFDNSGNTIWFRKYYNTQAFYYNHTSPLSFLDNSQNLYVCDAKREVSGDDTTKTILLKYNSSGILQWANIYNISNNGTEGPRRIFSDNTNIYLDIHYYSESYLLKVNTSGQQQWVKPMDHYVYSMNLDNSNNIITTGYKSAYQRTEMCMEKFSPSGSLVATYRFSYNGTGFDQATTFFNSNDSKIVLGGYHNSSVMLVKLTPSNSQLFSTSRVNLSKPILDSMYTYDTISTTTMQLLPFTQVKRVYVNIDTILHTATGDLNVMLVHEGKTDTLIYQRGGPFDNFIGTKLSDTCTSSICSSGNSPYTGYYKPCWALEQFNNLSASGPWILKIYDRRSPDTGMLKAWSITIEYETPIGIEPVSGEIPVTYNLQQNYPNPFNPVTKIRFSIPKQSFTKVIIYDITGKEISTLFESNLSAGTYETDFNASDLSSGIYFYKLITEDFTESKKMVLIK